jgi:hypothetical protein
VYARLSSQPAWNPKRLRVSFVPTRTDDRIEGPSPIREWISDHPTWWCVVAIIAAWAYMVRHALAHCGHAHHHVGALPVELFGWMTMVAAMMFPLILTPLDEVAARSLWARRHWAMALFILGYLAPWMVGGLPVVVLRERLAGHAYAATAIVFAASAAWSLVAFRETALTTCHRVVPLAPFGWRADLDCVRYGLTVGWPCLLTCWPLMVACSLSGHLEFRRPTGDCVRV